MLTKGRAFSVLIIAIALVLCLVSSACAITLAEKSVTQYRIVTAPNASASERTAAIELQHYLKLVTGADFPIKGERQMQPGVRSILVGPSPRVKRLLPDVDWAALGHDGIVIRTVGHDLVLAGGQPRGTLYAVYTFLEDTVGVRWWTGTETYVPSKRTLEIPALNVVYTPTLRYREAFYRDPNENPLFAAKLRLNGHFYNIPKAYGGHYNILGWCHTFYGLLPPDKYFAQHPDWYSEIGGNRTAAGAQLCLTNDEMRKELTRVALEWIAKNPTAGIISISQNDWGGNCRCAKCGAADQEEGSPSGSLIRFLNKVAEDIEKQYPDMLIETLAYQYTRKPPLHVRPRENVVVRLCSIECNFLRPLDSDYNAAFRDDMRKWAAIAPNVFIWDYVTDFASYIQPQPNMRVLAPNLRFFVANKTIGVFEQGDTGSSIGDFVRLRAWLLAHLEWDPSRDEKKLVTEFLNGYYGAAGPYLQHYLDLVHDAAERSGMGLSCYNGDLRFLSLAVMNEAARLFAKAEQTVAHDPVIAARVRRERLVLDHVWLKRYDDLKRESESSGIPFGGPSDPRALCKEFIGLAQKWNVGSYSEGRGFGSYVPELDARFGPPPPKPNEFDQIPEQDRVEIQEDRFQLAGVPDWVNLVKDQTASNGAAARMPGNHTQWAVQYHIDEALAKALDGNRRVYMIARCVPGSSGWAFNCGLYSANPPGDVAVFRPSGAGTTDGEYQTFYFGSHKLAAGMYVWVAPPGDANVTKAVYVDRFILVRDK